jgi:alcohol dehydrogenase
MFDFHCPTRIVFAPGSIARLGELALSIVEHGRVLVVSDPGIEEVGHTQRAIDQLRAAGFETAVFDGLRENPTTEHVEAGLAVARELRPSLIVAVGGGSSMDCAKGINFLYSCGGRMQDYWGVGKASADLLPMMAVPTTAGTGSEAQSFALISDAETHVKMACGDKRAAFRIALLDPELTLTQPPRVAALTGIDAVSHAVETLVTKKRSQLSLAFSREAWRLLCGGFSRVLTDPTDMLARGWMQQGACFAGFAIENSMLGAAHALANPLTAHYGIAHGQAVGVMLPHVVRWNSQRDLGAWRAYNELARELDDSDGPLDRDASALVRCLQHLLSEAGLATSLEPLGVEAHMLPQLAHDAAQQWTGTFNPVEMTQHDFLAVYSQAFAVD